MKRIERLMASVGINDWKTKGTNIHLYTGLIHKEVLSDRVSILKLYLFLVSLI